MRASIVLFIILIVTGCTYNKNIATDAEFTRVETIAKQCVNDLSKNVITNNEIYVFSFVFYVSSKSTPIMNANYIQTKKMALPYFIAPTLDFHQPGSAWRQCMISHNALVSNIQFPTLRERYSVYP